MTEKIEIEKLALVERLLIPMQNTSLTLRFILDGETQISKVELLSGLEKIRANSENMSQYLEALKDGQQEESTLRLPRLIRALQADRDLKTSETYSSALLAGQVNEN